MRYTLILLMMLAVLVVGLGLAAPAAYGQTEIALSEIALQAAGGLVGSAIGTVAGGVGSVPLFSDLTRSLPPCFEKVGRLLHEGKPVDEPQKAAASLCLVQVMLPVSFGSGLVIAGGALGTVVGIALVSQAQGRSGNLLAASLGVLAGNALSLYGQYRLVLAESPKIKEKARRKIRERPREGLSFSFSFDSEAIVESLAWSLLPVVLGVLAFNFL